MLRVLLTTTSFQDTPGPHHEMLEAAGLELVRERGPLTEEQMLSLVGDLDGLLCGDDAITPAVIDKALPRLRVIAKYGIGLDKVDVGYATEMGIPVTFTPGVNHTTVAEHTFCLLLSIVRNLVDSVNASRGGTWKRITGHEIMGRTMGIIGLGRIGREVAIRAKAFGLSLVGYDLYWPEEFAETYGIRKMESAEAVMLEAEIVSLHTNLTEQTRNMVNAERIQAMKPGVIILNCARGELVDTAAMVEGLNSGQIGGYGADVLDVEPPPSDHPLLNAPNAVVTPHIGSRTYESVQRQAGMAAQNLINVLAGKSAVAQANSLPEGK